MEKNSVNSWGDSSNKEWVWAVTVELKPNPNTVSYFHSVESCDMEWRTRKGLKHWEMEISSLSTVAFGVGMAFRHSPIPSFSISASSASVTEPPPQSQTQTQVPPKTIKLRNSKPLSATKAATLEVQQASNLPSTLARSPFIFLQHHSSSRRNVVLIVIINYELSITMNYQGGRSVDSERAQCYFAPLWKFKQIQPHLSGAACFLPVLVVNHSRPTCLFLIFPYDFFFLCLFSFSSCCCICSCFYGCEKTGSLMHLPIPIT